MAFVNYQPGNRPLVIKGNPSYQSGSLSGSSPVPLGTYANSLSSIMNSRIGLNADFNLNYYSGSAKPGRTSSSMNGKSSSDDGGSGGSGGRSGRPHRNGTKGSRGYYPSTPSKTSSVSFTSGIDSGTIVNSFQSSSNLTFSNLFINGGHFVPIDTENSYFQNLLNDRIYFSYKMRIQNKVNLKIGESFTSDDLYHYLSNLSSALQLYYMIDSIIAYNSVPTNKNLGMSYLRTLFTAEILSEFETLKFSLMQVPIPPRLMAFISYMYQNFTFSQFKGYPIYRLAFRTTLHSSSVHNLSPDYIRTVTLELQNNNKLISLLSKSFPEFMNNSLVPSSIDPIYDPNFMTFWHNCCNTFVDKVTGNVNYTRFVNSDSDKVHYSQFVDSKLDGAFYASSSLYNLTSKRMEPGIWSPIRDRNSLTCDDSSQSSSVLCFDTGASKLTGLRSIQTCSQSGLFHSVYYDFKVDTNWVNVVSGHSSGTVVQVHNLDNLKQSVSEMMLFLFSID